MRRTRRTEPNTAAREASPRAGAAGVKDQAGTDTEIALRSSSEDDGASAVEYALLLSSIAAVILGTVTALGQAVLDTFVLPWP